MNRAKRDGSIRFVNMSRKDHEESVEDILDDDEENDNYETRAVKDHN